MEFLTTPTGTIAVLDGVLPTKQEWEVIEAENAMLNVVQMPGAASSLAGLEPYADRIQRLAVNSAVCTDLRAVGLMRNLKWFAVGGLVSTPPDPSGLVSLEFFGGDPRELPGLATLPTIAQVTAPWSSELPSLISSSIFELRVREAKGLSDVSAYTHFRKLRSLSISEARRLSLAGVEQLESLERLELNAIKSVEDVSLLLQAKSLQHLILEDCPSVPELEALLSFSGEVRLVGRNAATPQLQAAAGPNWSIPRRRRP